MELNEHKINVFNREHVTVRCVDPGHGYIIEVSGGNDPTILDFQKGPVKEAVWRRQ